VSGRVVTRFAPSPTGALHLGHAYSAVLAHDAGQGGGRLLRIEDIDAGRCRPEHVDAILADLRWLGLDWDRLDFQSARAADHAAALATLRGRGLVYPCFCTRAEVAAAAASAPHGPTPAYPGTCRGLAASGRMHGPHAWRLDMAAATAALGPLWWEDAGVRVAADPRPQGDVVLGRKDAGTSYLLASAADDAADGVTLVVRGSDLREATHVQRLLQALMNWPVPAYHHHPLVTDEGGGRLAKRRGSPSLAAMRAAGADGRRLADALRSGRMPSGYRLAEH